MSDDIVDGVPVDQISTEPGATTVLEDFFEEPEDYFVPDAAPTFHLYTRSIKAVQGMPQEIKLNLIGNHPLWGHLIWNAGKYLSDKFDQQEFSVAGKSVLELGAGCALPSIICALRGARRVVITDYPEADLISNIRKNVDSNLPSPIVDNVAVLGHLWGKDIGLVLEQLNPSKSEKFDVLICSDLLFNHVCHDDLLQTIKNTLSSDGIIYITFTHHRPHLADKDMEFFTKASALDFQYEKIGEKHIAPMFEVDYGPEDVRSTVHMYTMKHK